MVEELIISVRDLRLNFDIHQIPTTYFMYIRDYIRSKMRDVREWNILKVIRRY